METAQLKSRTSERLVRIEEVKRLTGLSNASLYRKMAAGDFPLSVRLGTVARAWPLSEVQNWIAKRIALRSSEAPASTTSQGDR